MITILLYTIDPYDSLIRLNYIRNSYFAYLGDLLNTVYIFLYNSVDQLMGQLQLGQKAPNLLTFKEL